MRVVIVSATFVALTLSAWSAEAAAPVPPKCSASNTQRHATIHAAGYERYCGPGGAVLRVAGKTLTIRGGNWANLNRRSFGVIGRGGLPGKGFWARLEPVVTDGGRRRWYVRPGRVIIMDGEVQLPGFDSLPHQGTAIISKDLRSATFSLGSPPKITGSWTYR